MEKIVKSQSKATGGGYHEYFPGNIEQLPIRRIEFVTPPERRRQPLQRLISEYQQGLKTLPRNKVHSFGGHDFAALLHAVDEPATPLTLPDDVLHDFLSFLADRMRELNEDKNSGRKAFLAWVAQAIKIEPDKNGNSGIEALTGKTTLKNYLGDYQKDEEPVPFEELWEVMEKNFRRCNCSLDKVFHDRMQQEYERSLTVLLPIKQKLAATDWLIDQFVYRVYGLTEEQIATVEAG